MGKLNVEGAVSVLETLSLDELMDIDKKFSDILRAARMKQGAAVAATLTAGDIVIVNKKYLGRGSKISSSYTVIEVTAYELKCKSNDTDKVMVADTYMFSKI